jgi:glutathione synthase/RimK-type ligase-like ATP-grasp enzyme
MGYGKMKCTTKENWLDAVDMASISRDYVGIENFVHYKRDIRVLIIGEYVCCIERIPSQWKANVCPLQVNKVEAPESIKKLSAEISSRLGSNILGLDWVEDTYGNWKILEANLAPGLQWEGVDLRCMANEMLLKT